MNKKTIDEINSSSTQEGKEIINKFKVVPIIIIYFIWLGIITTGFGWYPTVASMAAGGSLFYDKPKGFIKKTLFIFFFALVLPVLIIAYLDIDAKEITQTPKTYETNTVNIASQEVANKSFNVDCQNASFVLPVRCAAS